MSAAATVQHCNYPHHLSSSAPVFNSSALCTKPSTTQCSGKKKKKKKTFPEPKCVEKTIVFGEKSYITSQTLTLKGHILKVKSELY